MIDLTPLFQALIALLGAIITYKLIPWIKARTTNEQQEGLRATIRTLVFAAEQVYGAGHGAEKLEYVADRLREKGFDIDFDEIEAAVYDYINGPKENAGALTEEEYAGSGEEFIDKVIKDEINFEGDEKPPEEA